MLRHEGIWKIIKSTNNIREEEFEIGNTIVFPRRIEIGGRACAIFTDMTKNKNLHGALVTTSIVKEIIEKGKYDPFGNYMRLELVLVSGSMELERIFW